MQQSDKEYISRYEKLQLKLDSMRSKNRELVEALKDAKKILQGEICTTLLPNEQIRVSSLIEARDLIEKALKATKEE